ALIGSGMGSSFRSAGNEAGFLEYFFPGIVLFAVVFAGIFSTITTIQDRQDGFLQAVLVAPIPRSSLVLGKVLGGTLIAVIQGGLLLLLLPLAGLQFSLLSFLLALGMLALVSLGMTGMGFMFAWKLDSVSGYHAVMNLLLMPMWLLSGAFFPPGGAHVWVKWVMYANPLTYGLAGLRHMLYLDNESVRAAMPALWLCVVVTLACALLTLAGAARAARRRD
ncbi:MAG: ABC transporter permease, partial [Planctomycetota bacterium]